MQKVTILKAKHKKILNQWLYQVHEVTEDLINFLKRERTVFS